MIETSSTTPGSTEQADSWVLEPAQCCMSFPYWIDTVMIQYALGSENMYVRPLTRIEYV
jgi:hypothetical protein